MSIINVGKWNLPDKERGKLGRCDSVHDFDDKGVRVPENCWDTVSKNLLDNLNSYDINKGTDFTSWLGNHFNNQVSASNVEEQTIAWFEKTYPLELRTKTRKILSYREFLDTPKSQLNSADIIELNVGVGNILDKDYSEADKKQVGLAILDFFFPPSSTDPKNNSKQKTYMSFDAHSNMPDTFFGNMDQVINLVTPLNLADSAGTESHLNGKNYYKYIANNIPDKTYQYKSNIYTTGIYTIKLKPNGNNNYERKTRYDYNIVVSGDGKTVTLESNDTNRSGPSVKYLSESIEKINSNGKINDSDGKMINIKGLSGLMPSNTPAYRTKIIQLLLDIKRGGDWEQANAANLVNNNDDVNNPCNSRTIFATIDRLCGLYSRCIKQNTIYHYGTSMILFKFPGRELTPAQINANKIDFIKEKLQNIDNINNGIDYFKTKLARLITEYASVRMTVFKYKPDSNIQTLLTYLARELITQSNDKLRMLTTVTQTVIPYNMSDFTIPRQREYSASITIIPNKIDAAYDYVNSLSTPFYDELSKIVGNGLTSENIQPYTDSLKLPIKKGVFSEGNYFYYDYKILDSLKENLSEISRFNFTRDSLQKQKRNYKCYYENNGFFSNIKSLIIKLSDTDYSTITPSILSTLSLTEQKCYYLYKIYTESYSMTECEGKVYTEENNTYVRKLQTDYDSLLTDIPNLGGTTPHSRRHSGSVDLTVIQKENLQKNIESRLLNEFITLSTNISNVSEKLIIESTDIPLFILSLNERNISGDTNEILLFIVDYINNISNYFNNIFESIDELDITNGITERGNNIDKLKTVLIQNNLINVFEELYLFINLCFLFGIILNKNRYKLAGGISKNIDFSSMEFKSDIANKQERQSKINFQTKYIPYIFNIFFEYFNESVSINKFRYIIDICIEGMNSEANPHFAQLKYLIIEIFTLDFDAMKLMLVYFSVFNTIFIENIKSSYSDTTTETELKKNGYYEPLLKLDNIKARRINNSLENLPLYVLIGIVKGGTNYNRVKNNLQNNNAVFNNNLLVYSNSIDIIIGLTQFIRSIIKIKIPPQIGDIVTLTEMTTTAMNGVIGEIKQNVSDSTRLTLEYNDGNSLKQSNIKKDNMIVLDSKPIIINNIQELTYKRRKYTEWTAETLKSELRVNHIRYAGIKKKIDLFNLLSLIHPEASERERLATEASERERLAKAERERLATEAAERERLSRAKAPVAVSTPPLSVSNRKGQSKAASTTTVTPPSVPIGNNTKCNCIASSTGARCENNKKAGSDYCPMHSKDGRYPCKFPFTSTTILSTEPQKQSSSIPSTQRQSAVASSAPIDTKCNCIAVKTGVRCENNKKAGSDYCHVHQKCSANYSKGGSYTKKHYQILDKNIKQLTQRKQIKKHKYTQKSNKKHNKTIRKTRKY